MFAKVFVLGRPGTGKTTVVHQLITLAERRGFAAYRMKDYEILYKMFQEDRQGRFRATDYGGFDVLDFSVFNSVLERLEQTIDEKMKDEKDERREVPEKNGIITIEFARNDYREALSHFSPEFLRDSYFFFVDSDVNTCIQRIHTRVTNPPKPDCHYVSDHIMHTYYNRVDDWEGMAHEIRRTYELAKEIVTYRNTGSLEDLLDQVNCFAELIITKEFTGQREIEKSMHQESTNHDAISSHFCLSSTTI